MTPHAITYTDDQVQRYLHRIHYCGDTANDIDTLTRIHRQHLLHIPYENLDIMNSVPLSLESNALFQKIILTKRGGYCFELQGLFHYLLNSLGYRVTQYAARFMDEVGIVQMRRHRILVVELNGKQYVCDVGVRSESSRQPLELAEGIIQTDGISEYCYRKEPFYGWVLMQKEVGKDWKPMLGFTEETQIDHDYVMPSFYCEKHPDSTFNKFMKISLFTADSNLTVVENTYKVYRGAKVVEQRVLNTNEEARQILSSVFGIEVPGNYRFLW